MYKVLNKIISSIVSKARNTGSDGWRMDTTVDNGPPSPQLPPLQRRRLSSIKDAKKISQNHVKVCYHFYMVLFIKYFFIHKHMLLTFHSSWKA